MRRGALALITGAPGWAGTRLVHGVTHALADGSSHNDPGSWSGVRCLVSPDADATQLGADVEVVCGDLRDPIAAARLCSGAQDAVLFHFAGVVHPRRRTSELFDVNDLGTRTLLAHAASAGVRRVVALSSNSAVGVRRDSAAPLLDEDTPCRPYLGYGRSKLAMEAAVHASTLESVVLRPCWFYGPGQPERQTRFLRMVREGKAPLVDGGRARRSLSSVDAIASAAIAAAASAVAVGRTYWIADARPYPMHEVIDTIESVLRDDFGLSVDGGRRRLPRVAATAGMAADALLQRIGLYQQELHVLGEMDKTIACSVARARRELAWHPGPGLREGTRGSVQWCLDRGISL